MSRTRDEMLGKVININPDRDQTRVEKAVENHNNRVLSGEFRCYWGNKGEKKDI
jgi:hypothetical protein